MSQIKICPKFEGGNGVIIWERFSDHNIKSWICWVFVGFPWQICKFSLPFLRLFLVLIFVKEILSKKMWICDKYCCFFTTKCTFRNIRGNLSKFKFLTNLLAIWQIKVRKFVKSYLQIFQKVLNLRWQTVCHLCQCYLKYWFQGISKPLDPLWVKIFSVV